MQTDLELRLNFGPQYPVARGSLQQVIRVHTYLRPQRATHLSRCQHGIHKLPMYRTSSQFPMVLDRVDYTSMLAQKVMHLSSSKFVGMRRLHVRLLDSLRCRFSVSRGLVSRNSFTAGEFNFIKMTLMSHEIPTFLNEGPRPISSLRLNWYESGPSRCDFSSSIFRRASAGSKVAGTCGAGSFGIAGGYSI